MAYRRKLTALFISAAFVLTLALSFFFIAKELSCGLKYQVKWSHK